MALAGILQISNIKGMPLPKGYRETTGWDDGIAVHGFEHLIESMLDPKTGRPIKEVIPGKAPAVRHSALIIRKKVSPATPDLYAAWKAETVLDGWELAFFHNPLSGPEHDYFRVKLTGAKIKSIKLIKPTMANPALAGSGHEYEEIAFTYKEITWTSPSKAIGLNKGTSPQTTHNTDGVFGPAAVDEYLQKAITAAMASVEGLVKAKVEAELTRRGVLTPKKEK
ncbi:MAG TPA: type VI secretion system tube protein TssD [Planctomycetota bacterium]